HLPGPRTWPLLPTPCRAPGSWGKRQWTHTVGFFGVLKGLFPASKSCRGGPGHLRVLVEAPDTYLVLGHGPCCRLPGEPRAVGGSDSGHAVGFWGILKGLLPASKSCRGGPGHLRALVEAPDTYLVLGYGPCCRLPVEPRAVVGSDSGHAVGFWGVLKGLFPASKSCRGGPGHLRVLVEAPDTYLVLGHGPCCGLPGEPRAVGGSDSGHAVGFCGVLKGLFPASKSCRGGPGHLRALGEAPDTDLVLIDYLDICACCVPAVVVLQQRHVQHVLCSSGVGSAVSGHRRR
uniref:Uncharacterized protein n=1 Tax=Mustela putorius furo TaxID=9669 RepID=M3Z8M3_MUSPF